MKLNSTKIMENQDNQKAHLSIKKMYAKVKSMAMTGVSKSIHLASYKSITALPKSLD